MSSPYQPYPQEPSSGYGQQQPGYGQQGGYGQPPYPPQGGWEPGQRGYLQGGDVNFPQAVSEAFKNIFTYAGRASRSAFWWWVLFYVIVAIVVRGIEYGGTAGYVVGWIIGVVIFFTGLSVAARRLHDADHSAFWLFLILLPVIGWIPLLVFYIQEGTPGPNRHG
jgi:uncharacterized membrane protein YhaH (DUF805 family)